MFLGWLKTTPKSDVLLLTVVESHGLSLDTEKWEVLLPLISWRNIYINT